MLAMQYTIQLPADYDMAEIDKRVEERKTLFKNIDGLAHKSYLANDEDKIYAPFYLWDNISGLRDFLLDDLFHGVTKTFRRPRVRSWSVIDKTSGLFQGTPTFALRESDPIEAEDALEELIKAEKDNQEKLAKNPNLAFSVLGLDPDRWELMRYSLWSCKEDAPEPESDCAQSYRILHV